MSNPNDSHKFGTFSGVFTPSILTIFGLIMFMRAGFVIGEGGIKGALIILCVANLISMTTALSVSAISTNTPVEGGGVYFLISRTLGPAFGGAIGIPLFLAQAISIPFYILGFTEALKAVIISQNLLTPENVDASMIWINLASALILFFISWVGAKWAIKAQIWIFVILIISICSFMFGMADDFSTTNFKENWGSFEGSKLSIYALFAIYFPAVTGIMTGVNMSGDLKEPSKSIPRGSLIAVSIAFVVYGIQILLMGGGATRDLLVNDGYGFLRSSAIFGLGFLVVAGVFAATLSSAIGSFMGAPRVMQALAVDQIFPIFNPFAKGEGLANEPRRATVLSLIITLGVLVAASFASEEGLNMVSTVLTMFFLYTYGMVNFAAFIESFGRNPSFRPRFRFYHWSTALAGAVACMICSFMISVYASIIAMAIIATLYFVARRRTMALAFGDARRGFIYGQTRNNLLMLKRMPLHAKNWRPTMAVLTGTPEGRLPLIRYAVGFECARGLVSLIKLVTGEFDKVGQMIEDEQKKLEEFITDNELAVFGEVLVTPDFDTGLYHLLQAHSIGPIKPNIIMQGWPKDVERFRPFMRHLNMILDLRKSCLVLVDKQHRGFPAASMMRGTIDIWWRGQRNGSLMLLLAYLLQNNSGWKDTRLRLLRTVRAEEDIPNARHEMEELVKTSRMDAAYEVIVSDSFDDSLKKYSSHALLILMGFYPAPEADAETFFEGVNQRLDNMPPTFLVCSSGEADLTA